jgi:1-aminocyclopropane-1-carboxylate deaminase/D-cysteine desulfhydrase-like pyridoxal-dependent ACC family enzyme
VLAIGVAKGVIAGRPDAAETARETLALLGAAEALVADDDVEIDDRWLGDEYGVPTRAGDEAIEWAARHGGWVLDRTYTGKGFSGLLGNAAAGRWSAGDDVVFVHTGGLPSVFTSTGLPEDRPMGVFMTERS